MFFILTYHAVSKDNYPHSIDPEKFEKQMLWLSSHFTCLSADELTKLVNEGGFEKNKKYAVITFDDGLENVYSNAFPILQKLKIPAIIFLTTSLVDTTLKNTYNLEYHFLNWVQMKTMEDSGLISIQCHGHKHLILSQQENTDTIRNEVLECKNTIEEKLNKTCEIFAYPKGKSSEISEKIIKEHFKLAFANEGLPDNIEAHKYRIPRIIVTRETTLIKLKLLAHPLIWKIKKYALG